MEKKLSALKIAGIVAAVVAVAYGYVRRVRNRRKEAQNAH